MVRSLALDLDSPRPVTDVVPRSVFSRLVPLIGLIVGTLPTNLARTLRNRRSDSVATQGVLPTAWTCPWGLGWSCLRALGFILQFTAWLQELRRIILWCCKMDT